MMDTVALQQLHRLVDIVNPAEYEIVYKVLSKFIAEAEPLPDEIEAIGRLDDAMSNGEVVSLADVDRN